MSFLTSLRGLFSRSHVAATPTTPMTARLFSTSQPLAAPKVMAKKPAPGRKKNRKMRSEHHPKIKILKKNMFSPAPPPLRMARNRHLRHWTIHRAWMLFRRQQRDVVERERERVHAGMYNACEELRRTEGPRERGEGYLYRVAMEKKNVYHVDSVPIEYARYQTESPATQAWNHDWKR